MYFVYFKKGMFNTMNFRKKKFYNPNHFVRNLFLTTRFYYGNLILTFLIFIKHIFTNRGAFCENYLKTLDAD